MDYFVPNFGQDTDIKDSLSNEKVSSIQVGHTWVWKKAPDGPPRDYFVPNFGKDHDVIDAAKSIANAE
jgi:hypothetical protein